MTTAVAGESVSGTVDLSATGVDAVQPGWVRPGYWTMLIGTAVLYVWGLGSSGWANSYYAAAAQAGTQSWQAWLFGSLDSGNAITVDKPPAAMWAMGLFGRIFGFNAWTMLLPQALMGVAAVAVLYATVRRTSGPGAGLIAGSVLALTPVAGAIFRYNNPDALLVLLLVVAAYAMMRAVENGSVRWVALSGSALGFAFLTKMLQAFLVVPGLTLVLLVAAPVSWWRRVGMLAVGGLTMIVSAGWYIALVALWPAESRPYIAGSTDNSLLQLAFGYNGIDRIVGQGHPGGGPGPGHGPGGGQNLFFGGPSGIGRMFGMSMGTEASWLLPAALIGLVAVLWLTRRAVRTDLLRAAALMWGGWLVVTAAVFSFMDGVIHPYYTVALAPAIAALVGIALAELWRLRAQLAARLVLAVISAGTGLWAFVLLERTPDWLPALRWIILVGSIAAAVLLVLVAHRPGRLPAAVALTAMVLGIAATAAYSIQTAVNGNSSGPMATSGPKRDWGFGGPGGPPGGGKPDDAALAALLRGVEGRWAAASVGSMMISDLELKTGASLMAIGGFSGGDDSPTLAQFQRYVADGAVRYFLDRPARGHGGPPPGAPLPPPGAPFPPPGMPPPPPPSWHDENSSGSQITAWVKKNFVGSEIGGIMVYDLRRPVR